MRRGCLSAVLALIACGLAAVGCGRKGREVVVYTSVDQVFAEPVFREYERRSGVKVRAVYDTEEAKSTGVLNRLLAEAQHPQADVFWSGDPVRPFSLIDRGLVEPYVSPAAADIPGVFKAADGTWTGFAARARVLLVNTTLVAEAERPRSILDLADPRWKGRIAIANPVFGTTTMHVSALFVTWGDERARRFMSDLRANGVRVAASNGEVKRLVAAGEVAVGLTDTDDANEAMKEAAPVVMVFPDQGGEGTVVMPTVAVLIRGGPHTAEGKLLIDYLVSVDVEKQMADRAAHMPVRAGSLPKAMSLDYAAIAHAIERLQPELRTWAGM
jgi:iron(III) transport system substrate-binding protein